MTTHIPKLVCFGNGGDTVYYTNKCIGSGYGTPERPHAFKPEETPDGTPVLDERDAINTPEGFAWVFKGPRVDVDLPSGTRDECPEPSPMLASAVRGNAYGTLLAIQEAHKQTSKEPGPLDSVSIEEYIQGWLKVGAKLGHVQDGKIIWE